MKAFFAAAFLMASVAHAQMVCGPYAPFGRAINSDGTWTIATAAACQNPDPAQWSHTYTLIWPSVITYADGVTMQFVGSASAYVMGHHDCAGIRRCAVRLVTVDAASFTDGQGNSYPLVKTEVGSIQFPVDEWSTTTPLAADTLYSFEVSGTDPNINTSTDVMSMRAIYKQIEPGVILSE